MLIEKNNRKYQFHVLPTQVPNRYRVCLVDVTPMSNILNFTKNNVFETMMDFIKNNTFEKNIVAEEIIALLPQEDIADYLIEVHERLLNKLDTFE
jgi:hypothetical protein